MPTSVIDICVGTDRDLSLCLKTVQKCFGLSFASFSRSSKNLLRLSCRNCLTYDRRALNFSPRYTVGDVLSFLRTLSFRLILCRIELFIQGGGL